MKAREIIEAETPRTFLKKVRPQVIRSGDDYYVAFGKPPLQLTGGRNDPNEYCPWRLYADGGSDQLDGMYGLNNEIEDHFKFEPSLARWPDHPEMLSLTDEEQVSAAYGEYVEQIHDGINRRKASGIANGVLGPRAWQLVYWPSGTPSSKPVPVEDNFTVQ